MQAIAIDRGINHVFRSRKSRVFHAIFITLAMIAVYLPAVAAPAGAAVITIIDDGGADDATGQRDLSLLTFDDFPNLPPFEHVVTWQWDDTAWSGANTGDAQALFDSDGDGFANYSLRVAVGGSPAVYKGMTLYSCSDNKPDRCTSPNTALKTDANLDGVLDSGTSTGSTAVVANADPFRNATLFPNHQLANNHNGPNAANDDTVATVRIDLADIPAVGSITLINVCSLPSSSPGSAPNECVINPAAGFLTIKKVAAADPALAFTYNLGAGQQSTTGLSSFTASQNNSEELIPFVAGSYSLSEVIPAGWQLDDAVCALSSGTSTGSLSGATVSGIQIKSQEQTICTFTNSPAAVAPDISVVKTANPTSLDEPGGTVTFSVLVTNNAPTPTGDATLDSLMDDVYGDLSVLAGSTCVVPQPLAGGGGTYSCSFKADLNGAPGFTETDTVTAVASNSGGTDTASDDATVTIVDVPAAIEILKSATPDNVDEPGGSVTYSFVVNNLSTVDEVTIDTLDDDLLNDLTLVPGSTCVVPQVIAAGGSYDCSVTVDVSGNAGDVITNVAIASGLDDDGNPVSDDDNAVVTVNDVPAAIEILKSATPDNVDEPGGSVTYSFVVNNLSTVDEVTIDTLDDDLLDDLTLVPGSTCVVPQVIAAGGSYDCSVTVDVSGNAGEVITNVAIASGLDDDGNPVSDDDNAVVTVNDVPAAIEILKSATPDNVDEPGGSVTYSFVVNNLSTVDEVTIDTLDDDLLNDLTLVPGSTCVVPQVIAAGGSYDCSVTVDVSGNAGEVITNVAIASGLDDDGNPVSDDDNAVVTVNDVPAAIEILKSATPDNVDEPGGSVTYSFVVNNLSTVDEVTIDTLDDDLLSDLTLVPGSTCVVPQVIAAGGSYDCSVTVDVSGNAGEVITNVATASGLDDDGNPVSDDDNAVVTVNDVPSSIEVIKLAGGADDGTVFNIAEPGGLVGFSVTITNTSATDTVTIDTITDTIFGNLIGATDSDCVALTLDPGESDTCTFDRVVSGNAGDSETNIVEASGLDDDNLPVSDTDDAVVTITDVPSAVSMTKTASPGSLDEPGGDVTFTFTVNNDSAVDSVTIDSLSDDTFGDLNGQGDCSVPQTILAGDSYSCSITVFVGGNAGDTHTNVATASGLDDDGNPVSAADDETVTIDDVPSSIMTTKTANPTSVPETGGDVTFTITVENTSAVDSVTINSVVDSQFGDVSGSCAPALPATLLPVESVTCSFTEFISGDAPGSHTNVATATGEDDDGNPVEDEDDEDVPFEDVLPDISIEKTADPTSVPETGGDVTFTFVTTNNSSEAATLDSLVDDTLGDLNTQGDCALPQPLAPSGDAGDSYSCSIKVFLSADDLADHVNVVTATASDDDGNSTADDDDATVTFTDVAPEIEVTKSASPSSVPETGGDVTFTFLVENIGQEDVTLTSLTDTVFLDLNGQGDCVTGGLILIGGDYSCSITVFLSGDDLADHVNVATAVATDDDGTTDEDSDDETVTFDDVLPAIDVTKTADPTSVPETGENVTFTFLVENIVR